jgi:hypothetical protein
MYKECSSERERKKTVVHRIFIFHNVFFESRDRCYDFLNIFAEKFSEKIGVFDSKLKYAKF